MTLMAKRIALDFDELRGECQGPSAGSAMQHSANIRQTLSKLAPSLHPCLTAPRPAIEQAANPYRLAVLFCMLRQHQQSHHKHLDNFQQRFECLTTAEI